MSHHPSYTMAGITAVGGAMAYIKKKSMPSLIAGLALGGLFALSGYLINVKGGATSSGVLAAVGASRYFKTKKMMPGGMMLILGSLSLLYQGYKTNQWYQAKF